jgi:hypothetical protein
MAQSVAPPWERTPDDRERIREAVSRTVPADSEEEGDRCEHEGTIQCSDCPMINGCDHNHACTDERCNNDELSCSGCGGDPTCDHRPVCLDCGSEVDYDLDGGYWN